jgi:hypothetical protein
VWLSRLRGHPEGPEVLSARCSTVESEVIAEVPPATPTMQTVQDSWMGLVTRHASGVWVVWQRLVRRTRGGRAEAAAH